MDVELRHLRALTAVAEELNFTRAAGRLYVTQQALSAQIRQLEQRVGTKLVQRDTRCVALTAAGEALYEKSRELLAGAEQAVAVARTIGGEQQRLTVGFIAPMTMRIVAPALQLFATSHPRVEVTIHFGSFLDPWGGLRDHAADVAVLYGEFDTDGLRLEHLFRVPRGIALAANHPLANKPEVTIAEFIEQPLVDVPMTDPVCRNFWIGAKHRSGKPPRIGALVQTLDGLIEAIGAGLGVAGTVELAVTAMGSAAGVVYRPVPGLEPLEFWVARKQDDERPAVLDFVNTAVTAHTTHARPA